MCISSIQNELEIKDKRVLLSLKFNDNEGRLKARPYNKRDNFIFPVVDFPCICRNIPAASAYGV